VAILTRSSRKNLGLKYTNIPQYGNCNSSNRKTTAQCCASCGWKSMGRLHRQTDPVRLAAGFLT